MMDLPLPYMKELATQFIFISVFLGGFSASILGTLIMSESDGKVFKSMIIGAALSAISFIVAVFAMTNVLIVSMPEYPLETIGTDIKFARAVGGLAFIVGIFALIFVISASGWLHSKRLGFATTIIGLMGLILILLVS